jgi:tetratricopeptide (TPR) repeat protein
MFYGRDDLVVELTTLVVNGEHIALIGPGGMGKSSLAKAILHESLIIEKFADRRFFVTYEGLDPSTITFETFMARFAGALGIEIAGADTLRPISTFLRSSSSLIVLDNAETFEEASASSALEKIPSVIAEIACIPTTVLILTSRSRRSAPNVPWITKDIPPLDSNSAKEAFFRIYRSAGHKNVEGGITNLLQELEFHPLSINLLANAAQQNGWSPVMLLERWKDRHSAVLDHGEGKLQSLSHTMQLSLNSPSIQKLGEEARHTLVIIAFLPQGLNEALSKHILPSILQIDTICDVLWRHSLVYRQDGFVKMLAPIRHYVRDSLPLPDSTYLQEIRTFYYPTVQQCLEERNGHADIITSDHLNIEHIIAFDLAHIPEVTYPFCWSFLQCLKWHLPRPTSLTPTIFNIVEDPSTRTPKAHCLWNLGWLYMTLSQHTESMKAFNAAGALCLATGKHGMAAQCVIACADIYRCQGRILQSQQVLEDFQRSGSWGYLNEPTKAKVWFFLDTARMYTSPTSADELFVRSSEDHIWSLRFKLWYWRAKFYTGGDIVQVNTHLEDLLQCTSTGNFVRRGALEGLAEVAFCEGRLSEAMAILQTIIENEGQHSYDIPTILKALVASNQGNHALARELINPAPGLFQFFVLRTAFVFLVRSYASACIELAAGAYDRARSYFLATIEGCDIQGHLNFKAYSKRGLGEIAFVRGDSALAKQCFMETWSLGTEMGVPLRHLYSYEPFYVLPDRFRGWSLFLEGQGPFANMI